MLIFANMRLLLLLFGLWCIDAQSQCSDSFSDGELNNNPRWFYTNTDFEVLSGRLHTTNASGGTVKFGISTPCNAQSAEFCSYEFQYLINPSSANYSDFWIAADTWVEKASNGYFIRAGNTKDEISLYRITNGTATEIISGADGELNKSNNHYQVWISRNADSVSLFRKDINTGIVVKEGTISDPNFGKGKYAGILIAQNGTTAIGKHYFDNIYIGKKIVDTLAPRMVKAAFIYPNQVSVTFTEPIKNPLPQHFSLNLNGNLIGNPTSIIPNYYIPENCTLVFSQPLKTNITFVLNNSGTEDVNANPSKLHSIGFLSLFADTAKQNDIIFTEIMATPSPSIAGLPTEEYVEIYNRTPKYISLNNYELSDKSTSVLLPDSVLAPFTYLTISKNTALKLDSLGAWVGLPSLPSLNNEGDQLTLQNHRGEKICEVTYTSNWHTDALKSKGGWSLERIDTGYYCINNNNWSSNISGGGSPGAPNTIAGKIPQPDAFLSHVNVPEPDITVLYFSLPVDSATAFNLGNYSLESTAAQPFRVAAYENQGATISLKWLNAFTPNKSETLLVQNLKSCGNNNFSKETVLFGRPDTASRISGLFINEVLFDPKTNASDYLELTNAGKNIISLKNISVASINDSGLINAVSGDINTRLLLPGQYLALTQDPDAIRKSYPNHDKRAIQLLEDLPGMSNDKGNIKVITLAGLTLDSLAYKDDFHSPILSDVDGVSLEKTRPNAPLNDKQYWTSAASSAGFGTPGLPNSQFAQNTGLAKKYFSLLTPVLTPNNDGNTDYLQVQCALPKSGFWVTMTIIGENGFTVATPFNNFSVAADAILQWDGTTTNGGMLPAGNYIALLEAFHTDGQRIKGKLTLSVNR